jgi:hypothetical protein
LPVDDSEVAKFFVYWLYRQRIYVSKEIRGHSIDSLAGSYGLWSKLWVVAEILQMKALGNDVVDGIWDLYLVNVPMSIAIVDFVYKYTTRRLVGNPKTICYNLEV